MTIHVGCNMHCPTTKSQALLLGLTVSQLLPLLGYIADVCLTRYRTLSNVRSYLVPDSCSALLHVLDYYY